MKHFSPITKDKYGNIVPTHSAIAVMATVVYKSGRRDTKTYELVHAVCGISKYEIGLHIKSFINSNYEDKAVKVIIK